MPDWSYQPLKQAILSKTEAKNSRAFIHASMSTIATIPGGRHIIEFLGHNETSPLLEKTLRGIHFKSPIGLSGSIDPLLTGMPAFQELGFGFLEIGPIVLKEPEMQMPPVWFADQIAFSTTPEKVPLKRALRQLIKTPFHVPVFARLDNNLNSQDLHRCIEQLIPFVDGFFLYTSQLELLNDTIDVPCFEIVAADGNLNTLAISNNAQGVVLDTPYTLIENRMVEQKNSLHALQQAVSQIKTQFPRLPIITTGGITTPADALVLKRAGADFMLLTEGYVKAGPGLPKRIHERLLQETIPKLPPQQWRWSFLFGLSIFISGILALFFALNTVILQYDEHFIGLSREQLNVVNPNILAFMAHDRMSLAGTMISAGLLYMALAYFGLRRGLHWAKIAFHSAAISGFLGILLFIGYGYFDWLHGLFWLLLAPIYWLSWREGKALKASPMSWHETNDRAWMRALYGQLLFVILGFSLVIGCVVISIIGITTVFVTTDITFLCMDRAMLQAISDQLIPVIAHDRAGFGSALISTGILVLCLSLWGFRAGERWLWYTLLVGALPAFVAGIGTHFMIGYTSFIHLVPLYFLCVIYLLGLMLSYAYLTQRKKVVY